MRQVQFQFVDREIFYPECWPMQLRCSHGGEEVLELLTGSVVKMLLVQLTIQGIVYHNH